MLGDWLFGVLAGAPGAGGCGVVWPGAGGCGAVWPGAGGCGAVSAGGSPGTTRRFPPGNSIILGPVGVCRGVGVPGVGVGGG